MRYLRSAWRDIQRRGEEKARQAEAFTAREQSAAAFLADVLTCFPYSEEARHWLSTAIAFEVQDLHSVRGGGFWIPDENKVFLFTAQYEAAIHELAHAWWHYRRTGQEDAMIAVTIALAEETDPRYARLASLAHGYIHGIPEENWAGMLIDRNDWEMYAGLASGMMADMRLIPPYVRRFYEGMYVLLSDEAPSPEATAPHR
jgi:hypothetical protein